MFPVPDFHNNRENIFILVIESDLIWFSSRQMSSYSAKINANLSNFASLQCTANCNCIPFHKNNIYDIMFILTLRQCFHTDNTHDDSNLPYMASVKNTEGKCGYIPLFVTLFNFSAVQSLVSSKCMDVQARFHYG